MLERRLGVAELGAGAHDLDEVVAAQVLHRDEVLVVDVADVVDLDDVRVVERRGDARLVEEHADELRIAGCGGRRIRLMTRYFSKPWIDFVRARKISAMPPAARRETSSYLPKETGWKDM